MDIISHLIFNYSCSNIVMESLVLSSIGSIIPDLTMIKRKRNPDLYYKVMHSLPTVAVLYFVNHSLAFGLFTHIFLDFFTHGNKFSPFLFFPSSSNNTLFKEWEFFNLSFFIGILIIGIMSIIQIGGL